jgi:hypothetical protein
MVRDYGPLWVLGVGFWNRAIPCYDKRARNFFSSVCLVAAVAYCM